MPKIRAQYSMNDALRAGIKQASKKQNFDMDSFLVAAIRQGSLDNKKKGLICLLHE